MTERLVSIIMPVKNTSAFLSECVNSIIHQSYTHWQLIAVDDHSTDNSFELLRNFSESDNRIMVVKSNGNGIIDALKTGYQFSEGEFITRMDSDDLMPLNKLETLQNILIAKGKGFVATGLVKYFSDAGLGNGYRQYEAWLNRLTVNEENFNEIYKECVIPSPCWMMWRSDFEMAGGFSSNVYPEDYDLCFRMYAQGIKVAATGNVMHHWRDYSNRTSRTSPHYADNRFLNLKTDYFVRLDYKQGKVLKLWGTGKKGKAIARILIDKGIDFEWITNNSEKTGKDIYGRIVKSVKNDFPDKQSQYIIAVASPSEQAEIVSHLKGKEYFLFC
jgi:glycosyltransferase involved in cell wall biosynthesis